MYSLTILVISAVIALIAGLGLGLLLGRRSAPDGQRLRDMEHKLDQAMQDKRAYEDDVVEHFSSTARLLNSLTESYREVHNHLASGASTLCHGQGPVALDRLESTRDDAEIPPQLAQVQPPLDYAPKRAPGETGMLNEEFGLDRARSKPDAKAPKDV